MLAVELESGRTIHLDTLHVIRSYAGVLEGHGWVRRSFADERLAYLAKRAAGVLDDVLPVAVIAPERVVPQLPPAIFSSESDPPEMLPELCAFGLFQSAPLVDGSGSAGIVVWFGSSLAELTNERAQAALAALDWESAATDFNY